MILRAVVAILVAGRSRAASLKSVQEAVVSKVRGSEWGRLGLWLILPERWRNFRPPAFGFPRWLQLQRFSPYDVRIVARVCLFCTAWKIVSLDYAALAELAPEPQLTPHRWVTYSALARVIHVWLLVDRALIQGLQLMACFFLVVTALLPNRITLLVGVLPVVALECVAICFRAHLYDMDVPVAVLLILALWSWDELRTGRREISARATQMGLTAASYIAGAYLLAGWSKLATGPLEWIGSVRLDLLYPTMQVWHGHQFPVWLDGFARGFHEVAYEFPALGVVGAGITLFAEIFWWTALVNRRCRALFPAIMVGSHVVIFGTSAILFLSLAAVGVSCVIPWRLLTARIRLRCPTDGERRLSVLRALDLFGRIDWWLGGRLIEVEAEEGRYTGWRAWLRCATVCPLLIIPCGLVLALFGGPKWDAVSRTKQSIAGLAGVGNKAVLLCLVLLVPTRLGSMFPYAEYDIFGWVYEKTEGENTVYRLGYVDRNTGVVQPVPFGYGGFFDFRSVSGPGQHIARLVAGVGSPLRERDEACLQQYARALRPRNSNAWLLGFLRHPSHLMAHEPKIALGEPPALRLLELNYRFADGVLTSETRLVGHVTSSGGVVMTADESARSR